MHWSCIKKWAAVVSMAVVLSGCGGRREKLCPIAGRVTLQGKPISTGMIRFSSTQAPIDMLANLGPDGTYEITRGQGPGLPEGTYRVAIMPSMGNRPIGDFTQNKAATPNPDIPNKYRDLSTSGLTFVVKPGSNTFDVDMRRP
jgi:glycine/D-amino acid oxidase-like deaminating enzyme